MKKRYMKIFLITLLIVSGGYYWAIRNQEAPQGDFPQTVLWNYPLEERVLSLSHNLSTVFIQTTNKLIAVNSLTGEKQWETALLSTQSFPAISCNGIWVGSAETTSISAVDEATGQILWSQTALDISGNPNKYFEVVDVECGNDEVYVSRRGWYVVAYQLYTGDVIWQLNIPSASRASVYLALQNDSTLYIATTGTFAAVDALTGDAIWVKHDYKFVDEPYVLNGRICATISYTSDKYMPELMCANRDGKPIWSVNMPGISTLIYNDNVIYAVSNGYVYALNFDDGDMIWKSAYLGRSLLKPIWFDEKLIVPVERVATIQSKIYAVEIQTGKVTGSFEYSGYPFFATENSPTPIAAGKIIVIAKDKYEVIGIK